MDDLSLTDKTTDTWPHSRILFVGVLLAFAATLYFTPAFAQGAPALSAPPDVARAGGVLQ